MRGAWVFGALVTALLIGVPEDALGQKNNKKDNGASSRAASPQDYAAIGRYREVVGKLQVIDVRAGTLSFSIETTNAVAQKKAGNNPPGKKGRPNVTIMYKKEAVEFELKVVSKAPLRKQSLGLEYDARGNIKEYSAEEKAKLRGKDTTLPGFLADFDELKPGSQVKLFLNAPKAVSAKEAKEDPFVTRPMVKMVLLLADPDRPLQKGMPKKK